ncbi:MAG: hypothetical protein M1838_002887 [Thelocarpon superellum]|nr:MAG: hypothetical protein M1838_002887 [Thelocarpon superellum]
MAFPPPPVDTIVNGHVESHFSIKDGKWSEPEFVEDPFLRIHGLAPGLNYGEAQHILRVEVKLKSSPGQQAYEGMKAFRDPSNNVQIFRPTQNAARMAHSASFISIPPVPESHFLRCVHLAVCLNAGFVPPHDTGAALYIRPLLFGSSAQLGLNPPEEYTFVVYVLPVGVYHGIHAVDALILEEFDRAAPEGTGSAKVGGNYAPVLRWSERARNEGYGITLHLDSKTRSVIDEFSTSAFLGIKQDQDDFTVVIPDSKSVIKSVTSDSCVELAKSFGELPSFTEVLAAGTAAALVPIKSITQRSTNDKFTYQEGQTDGGPAFQRLLTTLKAVQLGKVKDTFGWCEKVVEAKDYLARRPLLHSSERTNGVKDSVDKLP